MIILPLIAIHEYDKQQKEAIQEINILSIII